MSLQGAPSALGLSAKNYYSWFHFPLHPCCSFSGSVKHFTVGAGIIPVMSWERTAERLVLFYYIALSLWEDASEGCKLKPFHTWGCGSAWFRSISVALSLQQSPLWSECLCKCDSASKVWIRLSPCNSKALIIPEQDNCTVCVKTIGTSLWTAAVDASAPLTGREWALYFEEINKQRKSCLIGCRYMTHLGD